MPIYEYACKACDHRFEQMQRMSDDTLTDCPSCHQPELKKLISAAGFRLKGGGWYETDFKSKNRKNVVGSDGSASKTDTAASGKSDSKPAAKSSTTSD
jgi:putative FmdB family regulatory protein